ncbi:MAG: pyridoxal phosphate-dependent aminotransferase [Anaerolineales bacterium]|nr:pyridoxal phosphate-dependent aminotransferase [Anaerolineales bacterium]MBS3752851.1 pyridoxal phosphate-dependent aminotransferase [Anaerolineales bacterium]
MTSSFDQCVNRKDSDSVKWNRYAEDVLPLWVADMDFLSPPPVIKALSERVQHGVYGYPEIQQNTKEAVIDWLWKEHNWSVTGKDLVFLPGVVVGFNLAAHAFTEPGQGVLVQTPTYRPFLNVSGHAKIEQHEMPLDRTKGGKYLVRKTSFKQAIQENTHIFMLCNPQNPTGRVFSKSELETMAEICLKNNIFICSDEIHSDIVFSQKEHIPIATLSPEVAKRTITLLSPSKTFNIAGLKASYAVITNSELRERFIAGKQGLVGGLNLFGQTALRASYTEGKAWLEELLIYLENNRNFLFNFVSTKLDGVSMVSPEGIYLAWLDCRETGIEVPQEYFLKNAKVALNPGNWFGKPGEGFVRLNFACPRKILREGLDRLAHSL